MSIRKALAVINQMQSDGVIGRYAIGGAIGAALYVEATSTYDIDIFTSFTETPGSLIVSPSPIYDYLKKRGHEPKNEHVLIEGWLVQFLPAEDKLYGEALKEAVEADMGDGVYAWVMTAEHLMAIALKTGRDKDFERIKQFIELKAYDANKLTQILTRNGLMEAWKKFKNRKTEIIQ